LTPVRARLQWPHARILIRTRNHVLSNPRDADPVNCSYRLYCRIATVAFAIITIYAMALNLIHHQLAQDWFHSVLHLTSGLLGAYAGWKATDVVLAKVFTWSIGMLYFALGTYGWFTPGLFMNSPLAIPLSAGDNIVHLLLSGLALAIVIRNLLTTRRSSAPCVRR
jgi:hypothetical protein